MKISKLEATKRHLNFAIKSYFEGRDIVPISAIAGAAHIIAHDLVEHVKPNNSWASVSSDAAGLSINQTLSAIRKLPNWLKHANKDPDSMLEIEIKDLEFILFHAMLDVGELNAENELHSNEVSVFQLWFISKHHNLFTANEYSQILNQAQELFPDVESMTYKQQLEAGLTALLKM